MLKEIIPDRLLRHLQAIDHYWRGEPELRLLSGLCDPKKNAVDVGANIGTYTYFMQKRARAVWAYEPNPKLARRLMKLYPKVHVRAVAVSDRTSVLTLRIPGKLHELASVSPDAEGEAVEVPAVRLDDEALTNVGFIKIDVERHELAVLRGAMRTIQQWRPNILTEATPLLYPHPLPKTFQFIADLDYTGYFRFEHKWYPFSEFRPELHADPTQFGKQFMGGNVIFRPMSA